MTADNVTAASLTVRLMDLARQARAIAGRGTGYLPGEFETLADNLDEFAAASEAKTHSPETVGRSLADMHDASFGNPEWRTGILSISGADEGAVHGFFDDCRIMIHELAPDALVEIPHQRFRVVFRGETAPDRNIVDVIEAVAALFKKDIPQIKPLFSGNETTLKENLAPDTAIEYARRLRAAGAVCHVRPMPPSREESEAFAVVQSALKQLAEMERTLAETASLKQKMESLAKKQQRQLAELIGAGPWKMERLKNETNRNHAELTRLGPLVQAGMQKLFIEDKILMGVTKGLLTGSARRLKPDLPETIFEPLDEAAFEAAVDTPALAAILETLKRFQQHELAVEALRRDFENSAYWNPQ